jgi:hypothetical protein
MKWEKPAEGIMKTGDWGDTKTYHIRCECGSPECAHDLWVEADDVNVTVTIYFTLRSKWFSMNRWKQIWSILTKGYIETETSLYMDQQTAMNYAATLNAAVSDVKQFKEELKVDKQKKL